MTATAADVRVVGTIERVPKDTEGKQKGYAFVRGDDKVTYFLHIRHISPRIDAFKVGTRLEFTPVAGHKPNDKPSAMDCKVLN